jgi:hypothetical protein
MAKNSIHGPTENVVVIQLKRINTVPLAMSFGLLTGLAVFVATNWLVLKGGDVVGPHLALLAEYLVGYRVSFVGSLVGFVEVFLIGFATAYSMAALYNWLADRRGQALLPETQPPSSIATDAGLDSATAGNNGQDEPSPARVELQTSDMGRAPRG